MHYISCNLRVYNTFHYFSVQFSDHIGQHVDKFCIIVVQKNTFGASLEQILTKKKTTSFHLVLVDGRTHNLKLIRVLTVWSVDYIYFLMGIRAKVIIFRKQCIYVLRPLLFYRLYQFFSFLFWFDLLRIAANNKINLEILSVGLS